MMKLLHTSLPMALALAATASAQFPRVLIKQGDPVAGANGTYTYRGTWSVFGHPAGGNGVLGSVEDAQGNVRFLFMGSRAGEPFGVVREPGPVAGVVQTSIGATGQDLMSEAGEIVYRAEFTDPAGTSVLSVWREDTLLIRGEEPVVGMPGMKWGQFLGAKATHSGRWLVEAYLVSVASGQSTASLWIEGQSTPLLLGGTQIPGFTYPLHWLSVVSWGTNNSRLAVSRSGNHRLAVVYLDAGGVNNQPNGVALDEAALFVGGRVLQEGEPVPTSVAAGATWHTLTQPHVDDSGSWQLLGFHTGGPSGVGNVILHDGVVVMRTGDVLPGVGTIDRIRAFDANERGDRVVALEAGGLGHLVLNGEVIFSQLDPLDLDGDGVADPGITALNAPFHGLEFVLDEDGTVRFTAGIVTPSGLTNALLEIRGYELGAPVCGPAVPNSSGLPGRIRAGGSAVAGGRPLWLRSYDLPTNTFGYSITSQTQAVVQNPGGSAGTLCLGGSIGRFVAQVASSGPDGILETDVDTSAMPVTPNVPVLAGETWTFQTWFRDAVGGTVTSNFTDAVAVTFR